MELKNRPMYTERMRSLADNGAVKVLVGMRRCGKSTLLELLARSLTASGVEPERIVRANFESSEFFGIADYRELSAWTRKAVAGKGHCYLLLDEVQLVDGWERAVNAMRIDEDVDVWITGSNAYLLSSQIATLLSGRYVEVPVSPLTFAEFVDFAGEPDRERALARWTRFGGLPPVVEQGEDEALASTMLSGIYSTVFVKDVARHVQVRNPRVFEDVACYLADTAGSRVSVSNIGNRLASARRKTSPETIERYLQALVDAYLFRRARRVDVKGGALLQGLDKYYPTDLGIRNSLLGFPTGDFGHSLECAVHNELAARGWTVRTGKADELEVDFAASREGERLWIQVAASVLDPSVLERELAPFKAVRDRPGRRLLLTHDVQGLGEAPWGVEIRNVVDWMLSLGK